MTGLTVRRLRSDDGAAWERLWEDYNVFYERSIEKRITERVWSHLVEGRGEPFGFCATLDSTLVGFTHYHFLPSTSNWGKRCYMQDVYSDPAVRGKGVGRALIEAVYRDADDHDVSQTYWLTQRTNEPARRLYDQVANETDFIKYQR